MFKKYLLFLFVLFFLFSCSNDSTSLDTSWLEKLELSDFSLEIPSNWEVISDKEDILPKAKTGKIELAVNSTKFVNWFTNNILVLSDNLNKIVSSKDYSILNNIWAERDYLDYTLLDTKEFIFSDNDVSNIYIFEAKYNLDTPKLKFIQTAHICNTNKAFLLTLAISPNVKDTSKYEYLLSTFACK